MDRREQLLASAAQQFAARGFHGVSINELGAACGISGPAIYKHFASKQDLLAEMLRGISEELLSVARQRVRESNGPREALHSLIDWHVQFAMENKPLIVVQDRDWSALTPRARDQVRDLQRKYVDLWAKQLRLLDPGRELKQARAMAHAAFGLINSTPHSALLPDSQMRELLTSMALAALTK